VKARRSDSRQHVETLLLAVVEALIERGRRIGIALQRRPAPGQGIGPPLRALDRIARPVPIIAERIDLFAPLGGEVAIGLLEGRS
jgi:hypothetical protein